MSSRILGDLSVRNSEPDNPYVGVFVSALDKMQRTREDQVREIGARELLRATNEVVEAATPKVLLSILNTFEKKIPPDEKFTGRQILEDGSADTASSGLRLFVDAIRKQLITGITQLPPEKQQNAREWLVPVSIPSLMTIPQPSSAPDVFGSPRVVPKADMRDNWTPTERLAADQDMTKGYQDVLKALNINDNLKAKRVFLPPSYDCN